jgi:hypothetical protein
MAVQVVGRAHQLIRAAARLAQRVSDLVRGELRVLRSGVTAAQLGDRSELAGGGVRLDPVPRAQQADQLAFGHTGEAVGGGGVSGDRQARAAGHRIQRHPRAEPGRRAG